MYVLGTGKLDLGGSYQIMDSKCCSIGVEDVEVGNVNEVKKNKG
jgi:hypothetical protein